MGNKSISGISKRSDSGLRTNTLISGFTDEDIELDDINLSGTQLVEQQRKADMKLQLLQKQVAILEQRSKLRNFEPGEYYKATYVAEGGP